MSYQKDRDEFVAAMAREGVPVDLARRILRDGQALQRIAELECSSEAADRDRVPCPGAKPKAPAGMCRCDYDATTDTHEDVPRVTARSARIEHALTLALKPHGVEPVYSGDPRGAVVKLKVPSGRTDDWGQTGICVPTRG